MSVHLYRIVVYTDVEGVVLHTAGLFSVMYDVKHFSFQTCYALLHGQGLGAPPAWLRSNLCENTHGRFLACYSLETKLRKTLYSSKRTVGEFCWNGENFEVN